MPNNGKDGLKVIDPSRTRIMQHSLPTYTLDQIENVKQLGNNVWMKEGERVDLKYRKGRSILNILLHLSSHSLKVQAGRPVCKFQELMRWHNITNIISEDMLTTSFLASCDIRSGVKRTDFNWKPVIPHDCKMVNAVTEQEITDLHHHLNGSSLSVELNWLVVMNRLCKVSDLYLFDSNMRSQVMTCDEEKEDGLYTRLVKAAAIRLYLYYKVKGYNTSAIDVLSYFLINDILEAQTAANGLKDLLNAIRMDGKAFKKNDGVTKEVADYAIPRGIDEDDECAILVGERKLMYDAFKLVYSDKADYLTEQMLYAYLVMKCKFRNELIQTNEYTGFTNFQKYQDRKTFLIPPKSIYERMFIRLAIKTFVHDEKDKLHYLETRISPRNSKAENEREMKHVVNTTGNIENFDFVFHFIKKADNTKQQSYSFRCRHYAQRGDTRNKAIALAKLRMSDVECGNRFVGIDAASSEIACRPEVFAHAYRYLRKVTSMKSDGRSPLGMTYHVGEDFLDVVDGLRAVDEAIRFLNMGDGDRIGHGLVLGVDVRKYYERRYMTVTTKAQVWLDDVVWLYMMCMKHDKGRNLQRLKEWYGEYYRKIFHNAPVDIESYYHSMLLRGDEPSRYDVKGLEKGGIVRPDEWGMTDMCMDKDVQRAREDEEACKLYYKYHYDKKVKENGNNSVEVKIDHSFIENVIAIQRVMIEQVENRHIAIECNPSSNHKIGDFDRYIEHPIFKFFNNGIKTLHEKRSLNVSINTDDKGVFSTSLEREYALLAWALEKEGIKNEEHRNVSNEIAQWLDSIRKMGVGQKFRLSF